MSFHLVNSSLYKDEQYKDEASNHICQASHDKGCEKKIIDNIQLIKTHTQNH